MQKTICRYLVIICPIGWLLACYICIATGGIHITPHDPPYLWPLMFTAQNSMTALPVVFALAIWGLCRRPKQTPIVEEAPASSKGVWPPAPKA